MKKLLLIFIAGLVLVVGQGLSGVAAGDHPNDHKGTSLKDLAGNFADTTQGSFALCLDPTNNFAEISCGDTKAKVFPQTDLEVGNETQDTKGNSCQTTTQTISDLPPDLSPPFVGVIHVVGKITTYDPGAGSGDGTFTSYVDGKCVGANFNSSGAIVNSTGTFHFVSSDHGDRFDLVTTSLTDPVGGVGDFSSHTFGLRQ
jgi:hypothetical protein